METLPDLISHLPTWLQYLLAGLVLLATISVSLKLIVRWIGRWPMLKLWPYREGWSADCNERSKALDPNNAWRGGSANKWTHEKPMQVGDYFILDIAKVRVIDRIRLVTEEPRRPVEYGLSIKANKDSDWESIGEYSDLDTKLSQPRRMIQIKWTITKPCVEIWVTTGNPVAWSIYDIRLTEVRLLGRWWRKVIEEQRQQGTN